MRRGTIEIVAAVVKEQDLYLITQRQPNAVLPLLWEFPGGRVEPGESGEDALRREVRWRIGVDIEVVEQIGEHVHEYSAYDVHVSLFLCRLQRGSPQAINVNDLKWVASDEFGSYEFPPADEQTMNKLLGVGDRN